MNNQTEQGREPQYIYDIENAYGSLEQVLKVLYCFTEFAEADTDMEELTYEDKAIKALDYVAQMKAHLSMIYVSCDVLERIGAVFDNAITAMYADQANAKAVAN